MLDMVLNSFIWKRLAINLLRHHPVRFTIKRLLPMVVNVLMASRTTAEQSIGTGLDSEAEMELNMGVRHILCHLSDFTRDSLMLEDFSP